MRFGGGGYVGGVPAPGWRPLPFVVTPLLVGALALGVLGSTATRGGASVGGRAVWVGFQPASATFVSPRVGWALGTWACPPGGTRCIAIAKTSDGGRSWHRAAAPQAVVTSPNSLSGVSQIRFANRRDGWVFGPDLYVTHDGGRSWRPEHHRGRVVTLAASAGGIDALMTHSKRDGPVDLFRGSLMSQRLYRDHKVHAGFDAIATAIRVAHEGWLLINTSRPRLFMRHGSTWSRRALPCRYAAAIGFVHRGGAVWCPNGRLYWASGPGGAFTRDGRTPRHGGLGEFAVASPRVLVDAAVDRTGNRLIASFDHGRHWHTVRRQPYRDSGWTDLGFTTAKQGFVVAGASGNGSRLLMTRDGGHRWNVVHVSR